MYVDKETEASNILNITAATVIFLFNVRAHRGEKVKTLSLKAYFDFRCKLVSSICSANTAVVLLL
jgi:hypothetical protein